MHASKLKRGAGAARQHQRSSYPPCRHPRLLALLGRTGPKIIQNSVHSQPLWAPAGTVRQLQRDGDDCYRIPDFSPYLILIHVSAHILRHNLLHMQALSDSINATATTVSGIPDFSPYLDGLDPAANAYAALPTPKSRVLTDAEASITDLVDNISNASVVSPPPPPFRRLRTE